MKTLLEILRTMRPHQWVKNLFVVAPLIFGNRATELADGLKVTAAFAIFCVLSGAVYILNDTLDADSDREHPIKRHRPIASGRLPVIAAKWALCLCLVVSLGAAVWLSPALAAVGAGYFVLNVAYSTRLKHVPFLDVVSISSGFVLRLAGGALAIEVDLSIWLSACTFLLATFLALGKRSHELLTSGTGSEVQRPVLKLYRAHHLRWAMRLFAFATLASYAAYVGVGETFGAFSPRDFVWTLPSVAFGLWRFNVLAHQETGGKSPTDLMLRDPLFVLNVLLYGAVVVGVIYL